MEKFILRYKPEVLLLKRLNDYVYAFLRNLLTSEQISVVNMRDKTIWFSNQEDDYCIHAHFNHSDERNCNNGITVYANPKLFNDFLDTSFDLSALEASPIKDNSPKYNDYKRLLSVMRPNGELEKYLFRRIGFTVVYPYHSLNSDAKYRYSAISPVENNNSSCIRELCPFKDRRVTSSACACISLGIALSQLTLIKKFLGDPNKWTSFSPV